MSKKPDRKSTHKIAELVLDFDVYPRVSIDSQHATYMAQAYRAGATFPPVVIDAKSKRITDGFHRVKFYGIEEGPDFEIECIERHYASDKDMLIDSMRMNASHGRNLTKYDRSKCKLMAKKFRISMNDLAKTLGMRPGELKALAEGRVAVCDGIKVPIKRTIEHLAGTSITSDQLEANKKLSGMNQAFYARQIITLIESDMLDMEDAELMGVLKTLHGMLGELLVAA